MSTCSYNCCAQKKNIDIVRELTMKKLNIILLQEIFLINDHFSVLNFIDENYFCWSWCYFFRTVYTIYVWETSEKYSCSLAQKFTISNKYNLCINDFIALIMFLRIFNFQFQSRRILSLEVQGEVITSVSLQKMKEKSP